MKEEEIEHALESADMHIRMARDELEDVARYLSDEQVQRWLEKAISALWIAEEMCDSVQGMKDD